MAKLQRFSKDEMKSSCLAAIRSNETASRNGSANSKRGDDDDDANKKLIVHLLIMSARALSLKPFRTKRYRFFRS